MTETNTRIESPSTEVRSAEDVGLLKQIWALMLEHGHITHSKYWWSYYDGCFRYYPTPLDESKSWDEHSKTNVDLKNSMEEEVLANTQKLKQVPVDWNLTEPPVHKGYSEFVDTYKPSAYTLIWEGDLILQDGTKVRVYCKDLPKVLKSMKARIDFFLEKTEIKTLVDKHFLSA